MLAELCDRPLIEKTRYEVEHAGRIWHVDEFAGENAGLVIAEIELDHPEAMPALPPWLGAGSRTTSASGTQAWWIDPSPLPATSHGDALSSHGAARRSPTMESLAKFRANVLVGRLDRQPRPPEIAMGTCRRASTRRPPKSSGSSGAMDPTDLYSARLAR